MKKAIDTQYVEDSILGTLIVWPDRYREVSQTIYPFMFQGSRALADYVWASIGEGDALEFGGIITDVQAKKICTAGHIMAITESPALDDLTHHAHKLREAYLIREDAKRYSEANWAIMAGEDYEKVRAKFDNDLTALNDMVEIKADRREEDIKDAYDHFIKGLEFDGLNGVPTGFYEIDQATGGWQEDDYIVLGGRPGMGKTTLVLDFAYAAASANFPTMVVSLEMSTKKLLYKLQARTTGIAPRRMQRSEVDSTEVKKVWPALEQISEMPLYIFDSKSIGNTVRAIRDKAVQLKREHGIRLIVIDYIGLIDSPGKGQEEIVGNASNDLQRMVKQLNIPVIVLSQLNRAVETRGGTKRPQMADLRSSGRIEQDADLIFFSYRPEYYDINEDTEGGSLIGKVELILAKARMGELKSFWFDYNEQKDSYLDQAQPSEAFPAQAPASGLVPASSRPGSDEDVPF